eukprot:scaffold537_cov241-Pinguiococcus_pyrenoidosus.AAC.1
MVPRVNKRLWPFDGHLEAVHVDDAGPPIQSAGDNRIATRHHDGAIRILRPGNGSPQLRREAREHCAIQVVVCHGTLHLKLQPLAKVSAHGISTDAEVQSHARSPSLSELPVEKRLRPLHDHAVGASSYRIRLVRQQRRAGKLVQWHVVAHDRTNIADVIDAEPEGP